MHVVATAGHVDHGKSTLIRALTGMEPDRWAEERRRGMTIDLGFAWTDLPDGQTVAFVDVPGHERFVANMLAGIGPVPAALLVVAADEGWMPQSREHLDALHALGVSRGLLVVTRSDLMEPELAREEALEHLAGTSLAGIPAVCVSGATGEGIDELRAALGRLVAGLPAPDVDTAVRMWVDRAFTIRGAGTVVTGTLAAGTLRVGDELELSPGRRRVVVRGLQSLGKPVDSAPAVARVAVNLRGVSLDTVGRGTVLLSPGCWLTTRTLDVRLHGVESPDQLARRAVLHAGAAAVPARIRPLGIDTARLTLDRALPLRIGDRVLLRDPGAHRIPAGVTVLDIRPAALRRRGAAVTRAAELSTMDGVPDGAAELRRRGLLQRDELVAMGARVPEGAPQAAGWLVDPDVLVQRAARLSAAVTRYTTDYPLELGMPAETARQVADVPDGRLVELLLGPELTLRDGRVRPATASHTELPPAVAGAVATVRDELADHPFAAPEATRLAELGLGSKQLAAASRAGELLKLADGIYLAPGADDAATARLASLDAPFTLSQARQALHTTRRVAVPLMEHLARRGVTRRHPDGTHELR